MEPHTTEPFLPGPRIHIAGAAFGPLSGLTFAAKDLFDVAGHPTAAGNPDWAPAHAIPSQHAWSVQALLDAGATLVGKTVTDEISLGILGENRFDGTPLNPAAPDRVPGGSSSGSASAVASGLCDTALGTDTGGSVRVPASFCGLFGIRPTHGRVPVEGMLPQAPTSDTTGWFARDGSTFARVSAVLLQEAILDTLPTRLLRVTDAFGFAGAAMIDALTPMVRRLEALIGPARDEIMAPPSLAVWARAQRTLQPVEAYDTFRPWIEACNPRFAYSVARGLALTAAIPPAERDWAALTRQEARGRMAYLLPPGTILCLPTTPFPAPPRAMPLPQMETARAQINVLCAQGGLAGHPQVSLPGGMLDGMPVGLSIIGARGSDAALVAIARAWM